MEIESKGFLPSFIPQGSSKVMHKQNTSAMSSGNCSDVNWPKYST